MRFVEDGAVPADAQQVDTTWRYVNVKGGPDRRYKDNRQLPVLLYGDLQFSSNTGLQWDLKVSSVPSALQLREALAAAPLLKQLQQAADTTGTAAPPLSPSAEIGPPFHSASPTAPSFLHPAAVAPRSLPPVPPRWVRPQPSAWPQSPAPLASLVLGGDGRVEVVGESHYQDALRRAARGGSAATLERAIQVEVTLMPEPENPHDRYAVRVDVDGRTVGYLSRNVAPTYQAVLLKLRSQNQVGTCSGRIMGGGGRSYGIHLHLSAPGLIWPANQPAGLTIWEAARHVTVTGEERHQDVLEVLTPPQESQDMFSAFASLGTCRIATGKYTGQTTVEISINGQRVGQLTKAQADKYLPTVQADLAAGRKPGCQAYVSRTADRGVQVTALLPRV